MAPFNRGAFKSLNMGTKKQSCINCIHYKTVGPIRPEFWCELGYWDGLTDVKKLEQTAKKCKHFTDGKVVELKGGQMFAVLKLMTSFDAEDINGNKKNISIVNEDVAGFIPVYKKRATADEVSKDGLYQIMIITSQ
jgi:hypothetical protein